MSGNTDVGTKKVSVWEAPPALNIAQVLLNHISHFLAAVLESHYPYGVDYHLFVSMRSPTWRNRLYLTDLKAV